jgi:hypothetical protein
LLNKCWTKGIFQLAGHSWRGSFHYESWEVVLWTGPWRQRTWGHLTLLTELTLLTCPPRPSRIWARVKQTPDILGSTVPGRPPLRENLCTLRMRAVQFSKITQISPNHMKEGLTINLKPRGVGYVIVTKINAGHQKLDLISCCLP